MSIRCGSCKDRHDTVGDVRDCFAEAAHWNEVDSEANYLAEAAAENAWLRHAEDAGWQEALLDRAMEDARGVVQFEDAYAMAMGEL